MPEPEFPRGSEWRKWDLQVHTPFSVLSSSFGDNFENFAKMTLERAVEKKIAAIGVTDYFSIEGYRQLIALINDKDKLRKLVGLEAAARVQQILFLPNIELRTSIIITRPNGEDRRVNFHVIFSDDTDPKIIDEHFLRDLKFTAQATPASPDERWSLTLENLTQLGKKLKAQHEEFRSQSDLHIGMMNAVVSHEEVTGVLERQASRFKDRFLILVPADEDLSECSWNGQAHLTRKLLIQKSHMLFSANPGTRAFGLGRKHKTVQEFISEFRSLKPCVHSSDAHSYDLLFEPAENRYTWIKADPTFRGLKQLINEPEDRVFIGPLPPSMERARLRPTRIAETIDISKVPGSTLSEKWFDCSITLNPELIAVIGNKGSGKSALADILGLLGNTPRHSSFSFLREDRFRDPKNNKAKHFKATLTWADKTNEGPVMLDRNPGRETAEKIKYIPQNYLEEICNEVGLGKGSRFYKELQQVIFSHVRESERLGFDTLDELLDYRGAEVNEAIDILVDELKDINKQIVLNEERLSPRYREALESQLAERRRELSAHEQSKPKEVLKPEDNHLVQLQSKNDSMALEEKQELLRRIETDIGRLRERNAVLTKKRTTAEKLLEKIKNLKRQFEGILTEASDDFNELGLRADQIISLRINVGPIEVILKEVERERSAINNQLDAEQKDSPEQRRIILTKEIEELKNKLTAPQRDYQNYLQKLKEWENKKKRITGSLQDSGSIIYFESLVKKIDELPVALRYLSQKRNKKALEIFREKQKLLKYYESYYGDVQEFLAKHPLNADDRFKVSFSVQMVQAGFSDGFLGKIDQRKMGSFAGSGEGGEELKRLMDSTNWNSARGTLHFTQKLIRTLKQYGDKKLDVKDQLKQGESPQDLYDYIFSLGYISPIYRLSWDGKGLEQLSPGERGNLLLIFYLLVDRDEIPLVIDQPEENLDNETVVRTLVPCMKDAKKRRQIVMVTHNPNLAVVCDAEQVIYAKIRKDQANEVTYTSGSIEDPEINKKIVDVLEGTRPAFDKRDAKYQP
jgi:ABC-type lipoprotein export system ATPase subunit/archaellum component FlaC